MANSVLILNKVAAQDVSILNRSAVYNSDIANGNVFQLATQGSGSAAEVWSVSLLSGSVANVAWMAASPEVVTTVDGTLSYRGLNQDPRRFTNSASLVFDAYKPQVGDIITISADGTTGTAAAYLNAYDSTLVLTFSNAAIAGLSYKVLATTYISIGSGAIDNQRVTAYKAVCVAI